MAAFSLARSTVPSLRRRIRSAGRTMQRVPGVFASVASDHADPRAGSQLAFARAATALAALSVGAMAVGALAVGFLSIRRFAVRSGAIQRLTIEELEVGRLRVRELITDAPREGAAGV